MNLLKETLEAMEAWGKTKNDVAYVMTDTGAGTWEDFEHLAKYTDYDNGFGTAEVDLSLCVVFSDQTWLERSEYDGSEGWEYKQFPQVVVAAKLSKLTMDPW